MLATADEILRDSKPPADLAAWRAGRDHMVAHGMRAPDMETEHLTFGVVDPREYARRVRQYVELGKRLPRSRDWSCAYWHRESWEQGMFEAQFGIERREVQAEPPSA